jgi:hypothetical protein
MLNIALSHPLGGSFVDSQDKQGTYFLGEIIQRLNYEEDCWARYFWPRPGTSEAEEKLAYEKRVVLPDGAILVVGAGLYPGS